MTMDRYSDEDLQNELLRRNAAGCPTCRKWTTYIGHYDSDGMTLRCHGCIRAVAKCRCR